jgi:hypothetical protein
LGNNPLDTAFAGASARKQSKRGIAYVAILGVVGLASASSVFAASVTLNSGSQISYTQGVQTIAACDTDGITAALGAFYSTSASEFVLDTIELTGVANTCDTKLLTLELFNGSTKLATVTGTIGNVSGETTVLIGRADSALVSGTLTAASAADTDLTSTPALTYASTYDAGDLAASGTRIVIEIN